jgi:hypothetical protein
MGRVTFGVLWAGAGGFVWGFLLACLVCGMMSGSGADQIAPTAMYVGLMAAGGGLVAALLSTQLGAVGPLALCCGVTWTIGLLLTMGTEDSSVSGYALFGGVPGLVWGVIGGAIMGRCFPEQSPRRLGTRRR